MHPQTQQCPATGRTDATLATQGTNGSCEAKHLALGKLLALANKHRVDEPVH